MAELNPFTIAQKQLDTAAARLGLDPATHEFLRWPQKELVVSIPVQMDDGTVKVFRGYRVQYNGARGPNEGRAALALGTRRIDTVRALAAWMTWKTVGGGHPSRRGQGRGHLQPQRMSDREKQRLARGLYAGGGRNSLSVSKDVPAPDVYTTPQIMAWMMDEYETLVGRAPSRGSSRGNPFRSEGPRAGGTPRPAAA